MIVFDPSLTHIDRFFSFIKNPVKDFCWWDLDGVCLVVSGVVVVQW